MSPAPRDDRLFTFRPPYRRLVPLGRPESVADLSSREGASLLWAMGSSLDEGLLRHLRWRPGGVPLIVIAPPAEDLDSDADLLRVLELCRPIALVPFHQEPAPLDIRALLVEPPEDLAASVVDYLVWRGLSLDIDRRRILRRTVELSFELRSVSGLARALYLSRRALGRQFVSAGLPVPSHWLHFCRLLRAVIAMHADRENLMTVAFRLGYPDGFSLSNQMKRLTGFRPSEARDRLGWEWFIEAWIQQEIRNDGFGEDAKAQLASRGGPVEQLPGGGGEVPPIEPLAQAARAVSA